MDLDAQIQRYEFTGKELISRLMVAGHFATPAFNLTTVAHFEDVDAESSIQRTRSQLLQRRQELHEHCRLITSKLGEFRAAHSDLGKLPKYCEAQTLVDKQTGFEAVTGDVYHVLAWCNKTAGYLSLAERYPVAMSPEQVRQCNDLSESFPLSLSDATALQARLRTEQSVLSQNVTSVCKLADIQINQYSKPLRFGSWFTRFKEAKYSENESERAFRDWLAEQIRCGKAKRKTMKGSICFELNFLAAHGVKDSE